MLRQVKISKQAEKYWTAHPEKKQGILKRLQDRAENPNRRDLDIKPFEVKGVFRLRVGLARIIYQVTTTEIQVAVIDDRGDIYKKSRRRQTWGN